MCDSDVYVRVIGQDQDIKVAEMAKRSNGTFAAMADGYLYDGETKEEAARTAVDVKHGQAAARIIAAERVNESVPARKKWLEEEKKRTLV